MLMQETLAILERLCSFDTTSSKPNLECIEYCRQLMITAGFEVVVLPNGDGTKANLHAFAGPPDKPAWVFAGHTDVVPVDGQHWTSDPFKLKRNGSRLQARGAVDMKGFLAVAISLATSLEKHSLDTQIHIVLTYDEEIGCFGARDVSDYLAKAIPAQSLCVVGEPTDMCPIVAHKGILGVRATVEGSEGHAARIAAKSNAIHFASDLVQYLLQQSSHYALKPSRNSYVTPWSTIQVGLIKGGQARNMVAHVCDLEFEFRHIPEDSSDDFQSDLNAFIQNELEPRLLSNEPNASVVLETLSRVPAFNAEVNSQCLERLQQSLGGVGDGYWDGVTEAGYYALSGLDTIVCGPGSISQAHQPNEFVTVDALEECETILRGLVTANARL